jgi:hypothetical protein
MDDTDREAGRRSRRWDAEEEAGEARGERKERVLHTRVSESLARDIRRIAEDLRLPASNLVRNVLEEVFDVVEAVSDDVGGLFEEMLDEAEAARDRIARSRARSRRRREFRSADAADRAAWRAAQREVAEAERAAGPPPVEWHLVDAGRSVGPLAGAALAEAARCGRLGRDTLVWCAGMSGWQRAGEVAALAALFEPPPVPGQEPPPVPGGEPPPVPPGA